MDDADSSVLFSQTMVVAVKMGTQTGSHAIERTHKVVFIIAIVLAVISLLPVFGIQLGAFGLIAAGCWSPLSSWLRSIG